MILRKGPGSVDALREARVWRWVVKGTPLVLEGRWQRGFWIARAIGPLDCGRRVGVEMVAERAGFVGRLVPVYHRTNWHIAAIREAVDAEVAEFAQMLLEEDGA